MRKDIQKIKQASRLLQNVSDEQKKSVLEFLARELKIHQDAILAENQKDIHIAIQTKKSQAFVDRLQLTPSRIQSMRDSIIAIANEKSVFDGVMDEWTNKDGLLIQKIRVPLGLILMIYESRPNITIEATALALKSSNGIILRGGRESYNTNVILHRLFQKSLEKEGISRDSIYLVEDLSREFVTQLVQMDQDIDIAIARGSEEMIRSIRASATVPVFGHGKGTCHIYIDKDADLSMAKSIVVNAKVQRPGVCNAMECLLVHQEIATSFLPSICEALSEFNVTIKGCEKVQTMIPNVEPSTDADQGKEYLGLTLLIKVVRDVDDAIQYINTYGSGHTDAIVTEHSKIAELFLKSVDASAVLHNTSTRMHDGGVFGLGAEIGISTQKLHARGTIAARDLTTTKYVVIGTGQIRS